MKGSASEGPIWSAFNGLEGKVGKRGEPHLSSLPQAECCFWNFCCGINREQISIFFCWYPVTVFIVHEVVSVELAGSPSHRCSLSLSWICLLSRGQNGGFWSIRQKQGSFYKLRLGFQGGEWCKEGTIFYCSPFCSFFFSLPCFLPLRTRCFVAQRNVAKNVLIFQRRTSQSPAFPQKILNHTSLKNTVWLLPLFEAAAGLAIFFLPPLKMESRVDSLKLSLQVKQKAGFTQAKWCIKGQYGCRIISSVNDKKNAATTLLCALSR